MNNILPSDLSVVKNGMLNRATVGLIFNFSSQIFIDLCMQTAPLVEANASTSGSNNLGRKENGFFLVNKKTIAD